MSRKKKDSADPASPETAETAATEETLDLTSTDEAVLRRRISGEELKGLLRQQRREARLAEKGY